MRQVKRAIPKNLGTKLSSSISLPLFSLARLRHATRLMEAARSANHLGGPYSEQEVLAACLVMLLTRLRRSRSSSVFPRNRLYNDKKYSYGKVSTWLDADLWRALQQRALELRTSLSHLADIALRLYLRRVVARGYGNGSMVPKGLCVRRGFCGVGRSCLRQLLRMCSYQRIFTIEKHGSPEKGRAAEFQVIYHLKFG